MARHSSRQSCLLFTFWLAAAMALSAQTHYVILHMFASGPSDGQGPLGTPILDSAGNLYGTTYYGGPDGDSGFYSGYGTVYKVDKSGEETVLYGFTGSSVARRGCDPRFGR